MGLYMSQNLKPSQIGEGRGRVEDSGVKRGLSVIGRAIADF